MSRFSDITRPLPVAFLAASLATASFALYAATGGVSKDTPRFGFGKSATPAEIAGWDIDVRPDGTGLPPGRGTVAKGQEVYDEKCASCHGTFGESNDYMALAGGVGTLASDQPQRTVGSKLNHATTLWDYINRAMPFNAPKTLSADEVYALTAYVLHLSDILPADAALDRESILKVKMPNRDGFTTDHGFMTRDGKPDVKAVACMRNCVDKVTLSSEIPDFARDSHGNLAEQVRPVGPTAGAKTAETSTAAAKTPEGGDLVKTSGCTACHGVANKIVGPAFRDIGAKYAKDAKAEAALVAKIKQGGAGAWGEVPMPPQPQVKDADVETIVRWILDGAK
jgi:cytochrome c551/c552/cytochrome c553